VAACWLRGVPCGSPDGCFGSTWCLAPMGTVQLQVLVPDGRTCWLSRAALWQPGWVFWIYLVFGSNGNGPTSSSCVGARWRAWKWSGLRQALNETVPKFHKLVTTQRAPVYVGASFPGTHREFSAGTHGRRPKIGDPQTQGGPRDTLRPCCWR
jgi:hypothetical protein